MTTPIEPTTDSDPHTSRLPSTMAAVHLTGHGGLDKLEYRSDVPVPSPGTGEVLIEVGAAGINNTDINTRIGWYSKTVDGATETGAATGFDTVADDDEASWSGTALTFPRIQGADVCGRIVSVGPQVDSNRLGQRVLVRNMLRSYVDYRPYECWTFGSECDGGFAQFAVAPSQETHTVDSDWDDVHLAAVPCAYSTAENMLHRAHVTAGQRVLIFGASGGVGMAAVQLAKRRGATVLAVSSASKAAQVRQHGADQVIERGADLAAEVGTQSVDVIVDVVGGTAVSANLELLRFGGKYTLAGAIGGPIAEVDLRTVYLRDLSLLGCTFQEDDVFADLIGYIERNEVSPLVSKTYPLSAIRRAQEDFMGKTYPGKLVVVPPSAAEPSTEGDV